MTAGKLPRMLLRLAWQGLRLEGDPFLLKCGVVDSKLGCGCLFNLVSWVRETFYKLAWSPEVTQHVPKLPFTGLLCWNLV